ncbi:response regulator [Sphaerisporangium perillae]|uniref:response regulator n=1 Tax=Sphaerisporangium perillae TaxID=2935860 RepID=UPI00200C0563|nr:response regulator transcription factor [Sphaerisporangium perillae]
MIRVLIVDDHQVVRQGLRYVLEDEADIEVAGECADGHAAVEAIESLRPDVVLLDMVMPGMGGLEVLERLRERPAPPAVIVLTSFVENEVALQAMRGGALSYLSKTSAVDRVVEAVRMATAGGSVLDPPVAAMLVQRVRDDDSPVKEDPLRMLAPRERDVLAVLARGQSNREIARTLSLSETTVKSYVSSILTKLRLQDRTQAAIFGLQCGLVPLGEALSADQLSVED